MGVSTGIHAAPSYHCATRGRKNCSHVTVSQGKALLSCHPWANGEWRQLLSARSACAHAHTFTGSSRTENRVLSAAVKDERKTLPGLRIEHTGLCIVRWHFVNDDAVQMTLGLVLFIHSPSFPSTHLPFRWRGSTWNKMLRWDGEIASRRTLNKYLIVAQVSFCAKINDMSYHCVINE